MQLAKLGIAVLVCATAACDGEGIRTLAPPNNGTDVPPVVKMLVNPPTLTMLVGRTAQLNAVPQDGSGNPLPSNGVKWTSSDPTIARVSEGGAVTAEKHGRSFITATAGSVQASAEIVVTETAVASVAVVLTVSSLLVGQTTLAAAELKDANGALLSGRAVTWTSSNPSLATVSEAGLVTGVAPGTVDIRATSEGVSGSSSLSLIPIPVASVSVSPASLSLSVGGQQQLSAAAYDAQGHALSGRAFTWSSSNSAVASVSSTGLVTAHAAGSVSVSVSSEGKGADAAVVVSSTPLAPVATVSVSLASSSLQVGQGTQATATLRDAAGNALTGRGVTWASSDPSVATVSAAGYVTAVAAGNASISATSEGKSGSASLSVAVPAPAPVASVAVSPATGTLEVGKTLQLAATTRDASGNVLSGRAIAWTSSAPAIASVSTSGLVTAVSAGSATMTASSEGKSGSATITVTSVAADVTPPVLSNGVPTSGTILPIGTASVAISFRTNESATCRMSPTDQAYGSMAPISTTGGTSHSHTVSGLSNGGSYTYFARCQDAAGNANASSYTIRFSVASGQSQPLLFVGDAETGDASQWCHVHSAVPLPPLVTSPVRDGSYAFKSEVRDGALIYGTERSEFSNGPDLCGKYTYKEGEENYTAVSIYPETNFPRYSHWSLVTQFKGPHTGTPPMQISLRDDEWGIYGNGRVTPRPYWRIADIKRGEWNDFVIHAKWSPDPAVGWFEVYFQGQIVVPRVQTSTMYLDNGVATPLFLSVGQYRDSGPTSGTGILYVDAVKVGKSLADVMPKP